MTVEPFIYPAGPHVRRHGPYGYDTYQPYRDWLRDEFCFRCVYCLHREMWDIQLGRFHIDHFVPKAIEPDLTCTYENLLYACSRCNSVKSDSEIPDPCSISFSEALRIKDSGEVEALDENGEILLELLSMNESHAVRFRKMIIETLNAIIPEREEEILDQWLGFPDDLPDLSSKLAENTKPDGIAETYFKRRRNNQLPSRY